MLSDKTFFLMEGGSLWDTDDVNVIHYWGNVSPPKRLDFFHDKPTAKKAPFINQRSCPPRNKIGPMSLTLNIASEDIYNVMSLCLPH